MLCTLQSGGASSFTCNCCIIGTRYRYDAWTSSLAALPQQDLHYSIRLHDEASLGIQFGIHFLQRERLRADTGGGTLSLTLRVTRAEY